jgi:lipopolysaccharide export LptBFGC system permease protein LptF
VTGAAVIGVVLMIVGSIGLANTIAPSLAKYFWPVVFVLGGLALLVGGLSRDNHR